MTKELEKEEKESSAEETPKKRNRRTRQNGQRICYRTSKT